MQGSLSSLPQREVIARAIEPWWKGGGTTQVIIDVCRNQQATIAECELVAERMAAKVENGLQYVNADRVGEQLDMIRAARAWKEARGKAPEVTFDPYRCIFGDGVVCPQCTKLERLNGSDREIVHGALVGMKPVPVPDGR